jgi:phospholipid transport system substrate-binding protein
MISLRKVLSPACLLALVLVLAHASAARADDVGPRATVERLIDAVRSYKEGKPATLSSTDQANNARAAKMANSSLAIKEVSKTALGPQWEKLSAAQQGDFIKLVTDLFERIAYPKSSSFFGDLQVEFKSEKTTGDNSVVTTNVRHPKEGLVGIEYRLQRTAGGWVIHDILLDEVSLATDLRSQIQKVLHEESYARLIERMREKLKDNS